MDEDARMRVDEAWPPFGLRIRTERLELRLPTDDEIGELISVARAGIHPPEEMPFGIAFTDAPSPAFERGFVQHHWNARAGWRPDDWHLVLVCFVNEQPAGQQSLFAKGFTALRTVNTGSWLGREWQGRGIGTAMRAAVLAFAFDHLGAEVAESEAFLDNVASASVSRRLGYRENGIGGHAPRGERRETLRFRMTLGDWRGRPRTAVEVQGLDACLDLFGAQPPDMSR